MTAARAADIPSEIRAPSAPQAPAQADFPPVPVIEPPQREAGRSAGLGLVLAAAIAVAAGINWLSAGAIETAPALFVAAAAGAWWFGRRGGLLVGVAGAVAWTAATVPRGPLITVALNAALVATGLIAIGLLISAVRWRERALKIEDLRKEQATAILAVQLRESVVSIDVAIPLLADPMKLDRAQGAAFDQIRRHARGLARLANDLLTLDQVDTRKMSLTMVPVDLAAFVVEITEQRIPHDRATIVAPAAPVQVNADPERLRQLIDHLLQNALKFSPPSAGIMVSLTATADEARIAVRDHGVGLSADDMTVLFTRYGRIRDARTANVPGMGLGLYIAKLIAEAHGGDLVAASPGRGLGATFTIVLPLAGRPRRPRAQRQIPASSFWD